MSWMDDLEDTVEEVEESQPDESSDDDTFESQFRDMVETGEVENINVVLIKDNIDDISDLDLLKEAKTLDGRKTSSKYYQERIDDLSEDQTSSDEKIEEEVEEDVQDHQDSDVEEDTEDSEEELSDVDVDVNEGVVDMDREEDEDDEEPSFETPQDINKKSSMQEVDIGDIAPNAMTREQAENKERKQGIMVWGDPGMGKTHFAYTMPAPVCIIDTEGKGNDIAHKFDKQVYIWQPSDYDEVIEALEESFGVLAQYKDQADITGTIVVDSMSIMWDWAQQKYVEFAYPTKDDPSEVKFSSNMGQKGESDWKQIKRYHNTKFRQRILDSPYHFCWTAMRGEDYAAVMEGETSVPPDKPVGEKNNEYKANYIVKIEEGADGAPVGHLQKSALTKHSYVGLKYPTYEKHRALLDAIDAVETGTADEELSSVEKKFGVTITEGNPSYLEE